MSEKIIADMLLGASATEHSRSLALGRFNRVLVDFLYLHWDGSGTPTSGITVVPQYSNDGSNWVDDEGASDLVTGTSRPPYRVAVRFTGPDSAISGSGVNPYQWVRLKVANGDAKSALVSARIQLYTENT